MNIKVFVLIFGILGCTAQARIMLDKTAMSICQQDDLWPAPEKTPQWPTSYQGVFQDYGTLETITTNFRKKTIASLITCLKKATQLAEYLDTASDNA